MASTERANTTLLAILFLTLGSVMLDRMAPLFLGPFLAKELDLSATQIGLMASTTGACWAVSALVFGALSDRVGRRRVLIPAVLLFSVSSLLSGLAQSYEQMLFTRALLGLAEGPCWSVIMAIVDESTPPVRRGRNIGIVNSAGPLVGSAVAPVFTTQIATAFGWQAGFFGVAIPGLLCATLIYFWVPETLDRGRSASHDKVPMKALMGNRNLWLAVLGASIIGAWVVVFHAFAPLYITQVMGQAATTTGLLLGATGLGGFVWSFFGTRLADRLGRRRALGLFALLFMLQPLLFTLVWLYQWPVLLAVLAGLLSATPAAAAVIMVLVPAESVPRHMVAAAIGIAGMGAEFLGATLGPAVAGVLADAHGLSAPIYLCVGAAVGLFLISLLLSPTRLEDTSTKAGTAAPELNPLAP